MNTKHTPGPWTANVEVSGEDSWEPGVQTISIYSPDALIATYDTLYVEYPVSEDCAINARLIASAPELLGFAERVFHGFKSWHMDNDLYEEAKSLITKATGEQP